MKFYSKIVRFTQDALYFLTEEDCKFVFIFNDGAPEELAEISIVHTVSPMNEELEPGDIMIICNQVYTITAIGDEARHTLREMGHCTLCFKGGSVAERPGMIMLEGESDLMPEDVFVGGTIEIH